LQITSHILPVTDHIALFFGLLSSQDSSLTQNHLSKLKYIQDGRICRVLTEKMGNLTLCGAHNFGSQSRL